VGRHNVYQENRDFKTGGSAFSGTSTPSREYDNEPIFGEDDRLSIFSQSLAYEI
jgi:hypothetical protein